jgi:hypothetical protein
VTPGEWAIFIIMSVGFMLTGLTLTEIKRSLDEIGRKIDKNQASPE